MCRAEVALLTATACGRRRSDATALLESRNGGTLRQEIGAQHGRDCIDVGLSDVLAAVRNHWVPAQVVQHDDFRHRQEMRIPAGMVFETLLDRLARFAELVDGKIDESGELDRRPDDEVIVELERQVRVVARGT